MAEIHRLTLDIFYYYLSKGFDVPDKKKADVPKDDPVKHFDAYWENYHSKYPETSEGFLELSQGDFCGKLYHIQDELEDTNIIVLHCSLKDDSKLVDVDEISKLKKQIEPPSKTKVSLGYTSMIYGWGKCSDEEIAALYNKLIEKDWDFQREGKILGARVIEAWKSSREWDVPEAGSHVLIILYHNNEIYKKASKLLANYWITLLRYRHKIWYSYQEGRASKDRILEIFNNTFNASIKKLQDHQNHDLHSLKESLEKNLHILAEYSVDLNNILIHKHTLGTNLYNYNLAIKDFLKIANDDRKIDLFLMNDLKFLEEFSKIAEMKYEKQLEQDHATLAPGLAVLSGLTETIRGLLEVQQAEIDRRLNNTVAIVGLGLAASGAVAGIMATQVYQPEPPKIDPSPQPQTTPTLGQSTIQPTPQPTIPIPKDWKLGRDRIPWEWGLGYSLVIPGGIAIAILAIRWCQNLRKPSK